MSEETVNQFINKVSKKNEFQKRYLNEWSVTGNERNDLSQVLDFFMTQESCTLEELVDAYLFINNMIMEETYYFVRNGKYRNSTFEEVNEIVYQNDEYMKRYMYGLAISDYIWVNHISLLRYFEDNLEMFNGHKYLEIGPGFGQYLIRAINSSNFDEYLAVDISETSVRMSNSYMEYSHIEESQYSIIKKDFFEFTSNEKFDGIVMGEVLEHVENPLEMLKKIYDLLSDTGSAFVTTVINSPAIDHISLFESPEVVLDMAKAAGFSIVDYLCVTAGNISIEKAKKKKMAINIAMILKK